VPVVYQCLRHDEELMLLACRNNELQKYLRSGQPCDHAGDSGVTRCALASEPWIAGPDTVYAPITQRRHRSVTPVSEREGGNTNAAMARNLVGWSPRRGATQGQTGPIPGVSVKTTYCG
jgi:hypothetical protein